MTIRGEWYSQGSRPVLFNLQDEVNTCMLTATAKTQSMFFELAAATSTEALGQVQPCSSDNVVWTLPYPITIVRAYHYTQTSEENATCDNVVLYGAGGACAVGFDFRDNTTNPPNHMRTGGTLYTVNHAANQTFLLRRFSSTCSVQARSLVQVDFYAREA